MKGLEHMRIDSQSPRPRETRYYQFPLSALRAQGTETERIENIIAYCSVEYGSHVWEQETSDRRKQLQDQVAIRYEPDLKASIGARYFGVSTRPHELRHKHNQLLTFLQHFSAQHGRDAIVRIRVDLMEMAFGGQASHIEFCVLCAIYSRIGDKKLTRITRNEIIARANGCKSLVCFRACGPVNPRLSLYQIRSVVEELHRRGFFARLTYGRRQTYYSNRLSQTELRQALIEKKTERQSFRAAQQAEEAELLRVVREKRAQR